MTPEAPSPEVLRLAFEVFDRVRGASADDRDRLLDSDETLSDDVRSAVRELLAHDSPTGEFLGVSLGAASSRLMEPLAEALMPTAIGRYRVIREIGRGGFGRVYLAEQDRPKRLAAVKVLRAGSSVLDAKRLIFEAEALARLDHEAIAGVYECGTVGPGDSRPYVAMEYVEGVSLDAYARGLSFEAACALLERVCEGLEHAHQRGVLHRDLASKNILVDQHGRPRIIDFGLASVHARDRDALSLTLAGTVLGTLRFMSPEQLSGDRRAIDTRSDVFSLGIIVFETLAGRHPFLPDSAEIAPAIRRMAEAEPLHPSTINPALRGDAEAVLLKCVERDPSRRYQSAAALGRDLAALRTTSPVSARAYTTIQRVARFASRNKASVVLGTGVAMVVLGATVAAATSLRRAAEANDAAVNALDGVVTSIIAPLAPRVGTLEDRERLLLAIGPDVERMVARVPRDARVARIVGAYFAAQADICVDRLQYRDARPLYQKAAESYETAIKLGDSGVDTAHAASIVFVKLADAMSRVGENSLPLHERALAIDEAMATAHPEDLRLLSNLFWSYWRLSGSTLDAPIADRLSRAGFVVERMSAIAPKEWRTLEARSLLLTRRGVEASVAGRSDEAAEFLSEAVAASKSLLATSPTTTSFLKTFADAAISYASTLLEHKQSRDAQALLEEAALAVQQLTSAELDRENRCAFVDAIHIPLATLALDVGDLDGAIHHANVVIDGFRGGAPLNRVSAKLAIGKLNAWRLKGIALNRQGRHDEAHEAWSLALTEVRDAQANPLASSSAQNWFKHFETKVLGDLRR